MEKDCTLKVCGDDMYKTIVDDLNENYEYFQNIAKSIHSDYTTIAGEYCDLIDAYNSVIEDNKSFAEYYDTLGDNIRRIEDKYNIMLTSPNPNEISIEEGIASLDKYLEKQSNEIIRLNQELTTAKNKYKLYRIGLSDLISEYGKDVEDMDESGDPIGSLRDILEEIFNQPFPKENILKEESSASIKLKEMEEQRPVYNYKKPLKDSYVVDKSISYLESPVKEMLDSSGIQFLTFDNFNDLVKSISKIFQEQQEKS